MSKVTIRNQELTQWAKSYTGPKFHACFGDFPYGYHFMSSKWGDPRQATKSQVHKYLPPGQRMTTVEENIEFQQTVKSWAEAMLLHLYPGALAFVFAGTRMFEWVSTGMQMAGFQHWDTFCWLYGQGYPKAQDIGKMLDKASGDERTRLGRNPNSRENCTSDNSIFKSGTAGKTDYISTGPSGWDGYKTPCLKPSWEPILCFRAPRDGMTYAELATTYGTGALNIDGAGIGTGAKKWDKPKGGIFHESIPGDQRMVHNPLGRYPANLILDAEAAAMLGEVARFFYCAKASKREREAGCEGLDKMPFETNQPYAKGAAARKESNAGGVRNNHPTVKPLALTRHLATLLLPPASVAPHRLLIPFSGSGSEVIGATQAGWDEIVGIEQDAHFCEIAGKRIAFYQQGPPPKPPVKRAEVVSTLLYAGRKSWFVKYAAKYFRKHPCTTLIEPFAGSAVVGLSLLQAGMIEHLLLVEKDPRIVRLLRGMVGDPKLADRYAAFECTRASVERLLRNEKSAFRYLVQSRCSNRGKFDGGLRTVIDSRWCRDLVVTNLRRVYAMGERITVIEGDGLEVMRQHTDDQSVGCFADPTYTADVKSKGDKLYRHHKIDHQKLFSLLSRWQGPFLLTEDNSRMVRRLAFCYRFSSRKVSMVTAGNKKKNELMLWRERRPLLLPNRSATGVSHTQGETQ
jgi:site-specific DNA-adenine methylase